MSPAKVTVELFGARIALRGWSGAGHPERCKSVGGGKWDASAKVWTYPLDMATCRRLRVVFGEEMAVGANLAAWSREQIKREGAMAAIAASDDAQLHYVPQRAPRIHEAMADRTYQRVAVAFGSAAGSFLLADQPGVGKTLETLGLIVERAESGAHLVFCPSIAIQTVWAPEIRQWLEERNALVFELVGTKAQREETLDAALAAAGAEGSTEHVFVLANIEMARIKPVKEGTTDKFYVKNAEYPKLFAGVWDTIVVDESHRALIRTSGKPTQQRAGMTKLMARARLALSGTPMRGKPEQLWGTLNWLRPDIYTSYWRWVERYWRIDQTRYSDYVMGDFLPTGEADLARDLSTIMLRRTKAEVMKDLPDKTYAGTFLIPGDPNSPHGVWLSMLPAQARQYAKLAKDGLIRANGAEVLVNGHLAAATRFKQISGSTMTIAGDGSLVPALGAYDGGTSAKFNWLVDKLMELGIHDPKGGPEGDARIVVASQFTGLLNGFAAALRSEGIECAVITGETPVGRRAAIVADFQSDSPSARVVLINTKAAGVAITLDMADDLVMLDETYVPDDQEQVEDRIHRASRVHNVTIHYLRMLGTIEEEIAWLTAARENVQKWILDGYRGVESAKARYLERTAS